MRRMNSNNANLIIFMCGDVMTGRGIDQVLPHPSHHLLYAPYLRSARVYVELAEKANGSFHKPVEFSYIWGDALKEFERKIRLITDIDRREIKKKGLDRKSVV